MKEDENNQYKSIERNQEEAMAWMKQRIEEYERERAREEQTPPVPKLGMSNFKKAMIWTAISILVLEIIVPWRYVPTGMGIFSMDKLLGLWTRFGAVSVAAIIAAIVFGVRHKREIAKGIWAGLGIAVGIFIVFSLFIYIITWLAISQM